MGIVLGATLSGDVKVIIAASLGGGIANALSNILGAMTAERAAVMLEFGEYDKAMVGRTKDLKDTTIYERARAKIYRGGLIDGLGTFLGALVPVIPFFFMFAGFGIDTLVLASIASTVGLLFVLGLYLGKLSKENIMWAGAKMALFGLATAVVAMGIERLFRGF